MEKAKDFVQYALKALVAAVIAGFTPLVTEMLAELPTILVGIGSAFVAAVGVYFSKNNYLKKPE